MFCLLFAFFFKGSLCNRKLFLFVIFDLKYYFVLFLNLTSTCALRSPACWPTWWIFRTDASHSCRSQVPVTDFSLFTQTHSVGLSHGNPDKHATFACESYSTNYSQAWLDAGCCWQAMFPEPKTLNEMLTW